MKTVAVIQARMSSARLPGKVMLPLAGQFEIEHIVQRVQRGSSVDDVIVATSTKAADDIIEWVGEQAGVTVFRGDELNVLDRVFQAAAAAGADEVVRITADCPLLDPGTLDEVVAQRRRSGADYAANVIKRSFPRGLDVEAFSFESFQRVQERASDRPYLEHVTLYYRDHPDEFELRNVASSDVFDDRQLQDRTDLRLTLDEVDDYKLLREVYEALTDDPTPSIGDVVRFIDEHDLSDVNAPVSQKDLHDPSGH